MGGTTKDLLPTGDGLRRAVRWIGEERSADPSKSLLRLVDEAAVRFDLTPLEQEFLMRELSRAP